MNPTDTQEEVTTTQTSPPQQVVKKTVRQVEPAAKGEAPQKVYEKKKTILRLNQIIWYILGFIEILLTFRLALKVLGANAYVGFTSLIYSITNLLTVPFNGILGISASGSSVIEWSTIIAGVVYLVITWGLVYLLDLIYPISPSDV